MSECKKCGREDGHYIGCANSNFWARSDELAYAEDLDLPPSAVVDVCAFGECENPKRPKGKGPAPKYCTEHSDPKNRK